MNICRNLHDLSDDQALFQAQGVKRLYLTRNQLKNVPEELASLNELEHLNLR